MKAPTPELIELCGALRDETTTPEQLARLETLLAGDAGARRFYRQFVQVHALLERYEQVPASQSEPAAAASPSRPRRFGILIHGLALAACVALLAALYFKFRTPAPPASGSGSPSIAASETAIAFVQQAHGSVLIPRAGQAVPLLGRVELRPGDLVATAANGRAVLRFPGEQTLFILSPDTRVWFSREGAIKIAHLTSGQLYCDVAPQEKGAQWRILTADGEAAVLGTRLAVSADPERTRVAVTAGRVRVTARDSRQSVETRAGYAAELTPTTAVLVRLPPSEPTRVASFTVVDADTNAPLPGLERLDEGAVLDLAVLPTRRINVRANCEPQLVGAVRFALSGTGSRGEPLELSVPLAHSFPNQIEIYFPYMLAGDPSVVGQPLPGHSFAWTPSVGRYTLVAVPFAQMKDAGARGNPLTVHFEVVDSASR